MYGYSEQQPQEFSEFMENISNPKELTVGEVVDAFKSKAAKYFKVAERFIELKNDAEATSALDGIPKTLLDFIVRTPEVATDYHLLRNKIVILKANNAKSVKSNNVTANKLASSKQLVEANA